MTRIAVSDTLSLSELQPTDKAALIEHFSNPDVSRTLLRVPYPYAETDADFWLNLVTAQTKRLGQPINLAIRDAAGFLIGGIGFHEFDLGETHVAEIAYWLGKPYWGKGIMPQAVAAMCRHAFEHFGLERIHACVFDFNDNSGRVLEKCGFALEGVLRRYYRKHGQFIDARMFALLKG